MYALLGGRLLIPLDTKKKHENTTNDFDGFKNYIVQDWLILDGCQCGNYGKLCRLRNENSGDWNSDFGVHLNLDMPNKSKMTGNTKYSSFRITLIEILLGK